MSFQESEIFALNSFDPARLLHTTAIFIIAKIGNQPKRPPEGKWREEMWCGHTKGVHLAMKRNKLCHWQEKGWGWNST